MPLQRTEAFVLRTYSLAEAHKICVFFTRDLGKIRGVAHGARKMKSRFGSALEPFTEVSLTFYQKEGRDLVSVSACDIVKSHFNSAARDVETAAAFSYMTELLGEFMPEHEPNEHVYRLIAASLAAIDQRRELGWVVRYFESWLLRLGGFFPDLSSCGACGGLVQTVDTIFLAADGAPRCVACCGGRGLAVDGDLRTVIAQIFQVHPAEFSPLHARITGVREIGEMNYQIIRHALERDLRSPKALKQFTAV